MSVSFFFFFSPFNLETFIPFHIKLVSFQQLPELVLDWKGIAPPCFVLIYYYLEEPLVHYIANTLGHPKCAQKNYRLSVLSISLM